MESRIIPQRSKSIDIIITQLTVLVMAVYFYGPRVLIVALYAIICSIIMDYLSLKVNGVKRWMLNDFSQITTALAITLMLPASVPYWLAAAAVVIGIGVAKLPFGGYGKNIFNPAAVGYGFVAICWPAKVFLYPQPFTEIPFKSDITSGLTYAPSHTLAMGGVPRIDLMDAILGNFPSPAGAGCVFVILMCGVYLIVRRTVSWRTIVTALATVVFISAVFPRTTADVPTSIVNELFSGVIVFVIVFMANDPVTSPTTNKGQFLYGFLLAVTIMLFRYAGKTEAGSVYALILMNALKDKMDEWPVDIENGWYLLKRAILKLKEKRAK